MKNSVKNILFRFITITLIVFVITCNSVSVFAESIDDVPYTTYTYWEGYTNKKPVETKATYVPSKIIDGNSLGIGAFSELQHMYSLGEFVYILDSGNGRIVKLDDKFNVKEQIKDLTYNGKKIDFTGAKGIFIDENGILIADTENKRVLSVKNGVIDKIITKPNDATIPDTFNFEPTKMVRDSSGYLYLLCEGSYYGMMIFSKELEYFGFFGANNVASTFSGAIKDLITSIFETEQKHNSSVKKLPFTLLDICIDSDGFIVALNDTGQGQIRRFGLAGTNTLEKNSSFTSSSSNSFNFADYPIAFTNMLSKYRTYVVSKFRALTASSDGYYYAVDDTHGRIFMYDNKCNVISVFGGGRQNGNQIGTFVSPSSVCIINDNLFVSDFSTGKITVFSLTEYGKLIKKANSLTIKSHYEDAKIYWEEVNAQDKNCQLAYRGLARAALKEKDYKKAMSLAKTGLDRETYAQAFQRVRNNFISKNFWWIFLLIVLLLSVTIVFVTQSRKKNLILIKNEKLRIALKTFIHPFECFYSIKNNNMGSFKIATILMLLFYVATILTKLCGGFMFEIVDFSNYNAIIPLIGTIGIVILWTVSNWLVCILFEGKGKIKEIYCASCYCLTPLILYNFAYVFLSNILIPGINSPFELLGKVCYIFTAVLLLISITVIHDFNFFKSMATSIVVLFGMAIVAFVLFTMLTLWQELIGFVLGIINEVALR